MTTPTPLSPEELARCVSALNEAVEKHACGEYTVGYHDIKHPDVAEAIVRAVIAAWSAAQPYLEARPYNEWHEDIGNVLWWRFPIEEPPYAGTPLDDAWTDKYYTHFSLIPIPTPPEQPIGDMEKGDEG